MHTFGIDDIAAAAAWLRAGSVLASPEGGYGLDCDPDNHNAFRRIFALKRRPQAQGVLLIAASLDRGRPWIGAAPARSAAETRVIFGAEPDGVQDAPLGGLGCLTPITGAASGAIIRA